MTSPSFCIPFSVKCHVQTQMLANLAKVEMETSKLYVQLCDRHVSTYQHQHLLFFKLQ